MNAMRILLVCAVATCFGAAAARAQSLPVRAAAEVRFAMRNCLQNHLTPQRIFAGFTQHGFFYSKEDFGGGPEDVLHRFTRPDRLIDIAMVVTPGLTECRISTRYMDVPLALKFTRAVLRGILDEEISEGSPEGDNVTPWHPLAGARACSGYSFALPPRQASVTIGNAGQDPRCISDGTAQIMMRM
ncbi:MAG: hypothetical protein KDE11_12285 [Rhodobacteraceae bacterium]|nr:hypothetical protein [Paracoccaceae bacterium]